MGLDIGVYTGLKKRNCLFDKDGEPVDPQTRKPIGEKYYHAGVNPHFQERSDGIEDGAIYDYAEYEHFRAGSYGGYNGWREQLAELAGYPAKDYEQYGRVTKRHDAGAWEVSSGPFWELICFSDCEGVIGPVTSAKLAKDFALHQDRADAHPDESFRDLYRKWRTAFEMASQGNGAVDFH